MEGQYDCADLVRDVVRDRLRVEIDLPSERKWREMTPEQVADMADEFADPVETPLECDGVLMRIRGSQIDDGSHLGIHVPINGYPWILHNLSGIGTILTQRRMLPHFQLELVGYYRCRPSMAT